MEFVIGNHGAPGVSVGAPGMPANLEDIPAWYAKEYERKVWARNESAEVQPRTDMAFGIGDRNVWACAVPPLLL